MNDYKLRVGLSALNKNSNSRTVHIYRVGRPIFFFANLNSVSNNGVVYSVCIDKDLYCMYMAAPPETNELDIYALCSADEEIQVVLDIINRLSTYSDSTAKHLMTIFNDLLNEVIFETNEN